MYRILSSLSRRDLLIDQLPLLTTSMVISEVFYKFHSFTLECIAFLATWAALDFAVAGLRRRFPGHHSK